MHMSGKSALLESVEFESRGLDFVWVVTVGGRVVWYTGGAGLKDAEERRAWVGGNVPHGLERGGKGGW